VTDSLYRASEMETCVKEAYRGTNLLFSSLGLGNLGAKVAVTTIIVLDSQLCIISNYNRARNRRKECSK
jgi:GTP-dependent phosphoenolpyruvate carboxykinase